MTERVDHLLKLIRRNGELVKEADVMRRSCRSQSTGVSLEEKVECVRMSDRLVNYQTGRQVPRSVDIGISTEESGGMSFRTDAKEDSGSITGLKGRTRVQDCTMDVRQGRSVLPFRDTILENEDSFGEMIIVGVERLEVRSDH